MNAFLHKAYCVIEYENISLFGGILEISIGLSDHEESNLFLRALWSEIRKQFGKCSWLFIPRKDGRKKEVHFGFMNIGVDNSYEVYIKYLKKGVIDQLILKPSGEIKDSEIVRKRLEKCISEALNIYKSPQKFTVPFQIKSNTKPLAPYKSINFSISKQYRSINQIEIYVLAFDKIDAVSLAKGLINYILDFLSVCTNSVFDIVNSKYQNKSINSTNEYYEDFNWIDDFPIKNERLMLWEKEVVFINDIISGKIDNNGFLRACTHFHKAMRLFKYAYSEQLIEICLVLFVSSIETASTLFKYDGTTCMQCGQAIYSIRKRVLNLVEKYSNSDIIIGIIDEYYADRSKYLHAGVLLSEYNYERASIPLLDKLSESGCRAQIPMKSSKLEEITSYILRNIFLDIIK